MARHQLSRGQLARRAREVPKPELAIATASEAAADELMVAETVVHGDEATLGEATAVEGTAGETAA